MATMIIQTYVLVIPPDILLLRQLPPLATSFPVATGTLTRNYVATYLLEFVVVNCPLKLQAAA